MEYQSLPMFSSGEKDNYRVSTLPEQINSKWNVLHLIEVMVQYGKGMIVPDFNKETSCRIVKLIK